MPPHFLDGLQKLFQTFCGKILRLHRNQEMCIRDRLHIAGDDKPAEVVRSRFMKLNADHIHFVLKLSLIHI